MVWVGGNLLYGNKNTLEKVKSGQCEDLKVYGSNKKICVKDTTEQIPKNDQTLTIIKDILQQAYPGLAPLTP